MTDIDEPGALGPALGTAREEVRVIGCLDRSSSMLRYDKYQVVASRYPVALSELAAAAPAARVETWWFAHDVSCFAELEAVADVPVPSLEAYYDAIAAGSAIADCLVRGIERADTIRAQRGPAPTKVILWTDGWNRHSHHTPRGARAVMERSPWVEVFLIGFVDAELRHELDNFVGELGLGADNVFIFEHRDDPDDSRRAAEASSEAFGSTARRWHRRA